MVTDVWTSNSPPVHLNLETVNQTGVPDEFMGGPNLAGYDLEGGLHRFSRYEADVALLWFRISEAEWRNWSQFKIAFRRRFGNYDFAARVREQI